MSYYLMEADASNRAEAEKEILKTLGLEKDQLEFEVISEKKGLIGLFKGSKSSILAFPASDDLPIEAHVKGVLLTMVQKMGVEAEVKQIGSKDGNFYIEITSPDSGFLIGKHGRTLDALQFLVNLIVHTRSKDKQRIMIDVDGYRERREKNLKKLADRMADKVSKSGRSMLLNYMSPYERRIVHMYLEPDERVKTESDGNGVHKRLRIISTEKRESKRSRRGGRRKSHAGHSDLSTDEQPTEHNEHYEQLADEREDFEAQQLYEEPEVQEKIIEG